VREYTKEGRQKTTQMMQEVRFFALCLFYHVSDDRSFIAQKACVCQGIWWQLALSGTS
jgi:hypothetical protein